MLMASVCDVNTSMCNLNLQPTSFQPIPYCWYFEVYFYINWWLMMIGCAMCVMIKNQSKKRRKDDEVGRRQRHVVTSLHLVEHVISSFPLLIIIDCLSSFYKEKTPLTCALNGKIWLADAKSTNHRYVSIIWDGGSRECLMFYHEYLLLLLLLY
jgi:hypothetical protein